jgi:hypothetical protein
MPVRKGRPRTTSKAGTSQKSTGGPKPAEFFAQQLKGEPPLKFATAERLYGLAAEVFAIKPWEFLGDGELFLVKDPVSGQMCYCSVMGALGEVFSLFAYVGEESYSFLRALVSGKNVFPSDFYRLTRGVQVEFVPSSELTSPDRELLKAFAHPAGRGMAAPQFRALRPGNRPWYPTDAEGMTVAACMEALLALCDSLLANHSLNYWREEDFYPLLTPRTTTEHRTEYALEMKKVSEPQMAEPGPAALDEGRLKRILEKDYPLRGALEADCFDSGTVEGGKEERKACIYVSLVTDAASGFLFQPELGTLADGMGNLLARAIMNAIEQLKFLPQEIRVPNKERRAELAMLEQRMGIPVRVVKSIPSLREAQTALMKHMQGLER